MNKLSVIVPSRNEIFLNRTINDIFEKSVGEIEVIAVLDGYWPQFDAQNGEKIWLMPKENENLKYLHFGNAKGMRAAINAGVTLATGKYIMKCDGHCMFSEGFDDVLKSDCDDNWMVIPSRYSLDATNWRILETGKSRVDYHYLSFPKYKGDGIHGNVWNERARERINNSQYNIDDEMSFQGSCWFMHRKHFVDFIGSMNEEGYGTFIQEPQEIGMKTWLGGGRIVVNKNTWYAHLHKGKQVHYNNDAGEDKIVAQQYRGYFLNKREAEQGNDYSARFWLTDQWNDRIRDISWLVDKFWPIPGWPENWKELINERT